MNIPTKIKQFRLIKTREKIPIEQNWTKTRNYSYNDKIFQDFIKTNHTYGVFCGYNGLLVVDVDDLDTQKQLLQLDIFKNTFTVKTAGKGLYHFYFISNKTNSFKCLDKDKKTLIDIQGNGKQIIGPRSTLANGRSYEVVNDSPIKQIDYDELKKILIKFNYEDESEEGTQKTQNYDTNPLIEEIKSKIKVKDILREIGISTRKNPTECPFHESVGKKCFSYSDDVWYCFHCLRTGNIFKLYQLYYKVDFPTAKEKLMKLAGIDKPKKLIKYEEQKREEIRSLVDYNALDIKKFIIFKSKDETIYKIFINDFFIILTPDTILGSSDFRKKYFNETGQLLGNIKATKWVELVNRWMNECGQIVEQTEDVGTDNMILETVVSEIQNFAVVDNSIDATTYGRVLFIDKERDYIFICNKVLNTILKKNQFKINLSKLKVILDEYIEGKTKVIRTGSTVHRFFRFKLEKLPDLSIDEFLQNLEQEKKAEDQDGEIKEKDL